jgi:Fe-S cluster biosynthesis and repair protein YggX
MKIYIVGDYGPEHYSIKSIHKTYDGALKAWNVHRTSLLNSAKYMMENSPEDRKMYAGIVKVLSCKDPEKIKDAGFCDEMPFLEEKKVVE